MTVEMTPSIPDIIESQLPESVATVANARFVSLLKHYYTWLIANGQPAEFINKMLSYRDIDLSSGVFKEHMLDIILSDVPAYARTDRATMYKHMTEFLKAKGSVSSIETVMLAIFGEPATVEYYSDKIFKASANQYTRTSTLSIESIAPWDNVTGSILLQVVPTPARGVIKSITSTLHDGIYINALELEDKSVSGVFEQGNTVSVLRNTINRSWFTPSEYYTGVSFASNTLTFSAQTEESRPYNNLIVKQLDSTFRAVITAFVSRKEETGYNVITLTTNTVTGTFIVGKELYIIPSTIESTLYTKTDYESGTVSKTVASINVVSGGALYRSGDKLSFIDNDISPVHFVDALVSGVTSDGVSTVDIISKGYGYSAGRALVVDNRETNGSGFSAEVSSIDGINGKITSISELNTIQIQNSGTGYALNDEFEINGDVRIPGTLPARVRVSAVNSAWLFKGINITSSGYSYPAYTKIQLINSSTLAVIAGFAATPTFNAVGGIFAITITSIPVITTGDLIVIANGYGATATTTMTSGAITSVTVVNTGINYIDPVVEVIGNGKDALIRAVMTGTSITSYSILTAGTGYTTSSIIVRERYGSGFAATALIQNQTAALGSVTGVTVLTRGRYVEVPDCFAVSANNQIGTGSGLTINLDFRLETATITDRGQFYRAVGTSVTGKGRNAVLKPNLTNGVVNTVNKVTAGTGFTYALVTISEGTGFVGTANILLGAVDSITVVSGGSGYSTASVVTITGDGTGASYNLLTANLYDGVLSSVVVDNQGEYYFHGTTITCPATAIGSISATLTPVIVKGKIKSVTTTGGKGYLANDLNSFAVNSGVLATLTSSLTTSTSIIDSITVNQGRGYYSQSEKTPLSITTGVAGAGAVFIPTIDELGGISSVLVLHSGAGYTSASTVSVAGTGTGAILSLVITNGTVTDVIVIVKGVGYVYGTSAIIIGDGAGAAITPIVFTGLSTASVLTGGVNYPQTTTVTVTDVSGTGAVVRPVINSKGTITSLSIVNSGTGYVSPVLTLANVGSGTGATISGTALRNIERLSIVTGGTGYTTANIIIIGDGANAEYSLILEESGSIDITAIADKGTGYTTTPLIAVTDNSGYGAVSGVKIIQRGAGYEVPPKLSLPVLRDIYGNITAQSTKCICFGAEMGSVRSVIVSSHGANLHVIPRALFDLRGILTYSAPFIIGEEVKLVGGQYKSLTPEYILLESADRLITEDSNPLILDKDMSLYDISPIGRVVNFDYDQNTIHLDQLSDNFEITDENRIDIITEDGFSIVDQESGSFKVYDTIIGTNSGAKATFKYLNRAAGQTNIGGHAWNEFKFINDSGKLNSVRSILPDNHRYQEYAYSISSSIALDSYQRVLKDMAHPVGYTLFANVKCPSYAVTGMLDEIGYNRTVSLLYLVSIAKDAKVWDGLTEMKYLFSDKTKFNLEFMPISYILGYNIPQVSDFLKTKYNDYITPPITTAAVSSWSVLNTTQRTYNTGIDHFGANEMTTLTDTSSYSVSGISKTVTCAIGDVIFLECAIAKQIAPTTYPRIVLDGNNIIDLNVDTAFYTASPSAMVVDIINIAEFIIVRLKATATATSFACDIYPSVGYTASFGTVDLTALGNIKVSNVIIKNITSVTPLATDIFVYNHAYQPTQFEIQGTEAKLIIT